MRLGIGSYTFGWAVQERRLCAMDLIAQAARWKIAVVQLCNNLPTQAFESNSLASLAAEARRQCISLELGTQGSHPDHLRAMITKAREVESPILRVVVDSPCDQPAPAEVVKRLTAILPELRQAHVTLAIENHDRFASATLAGIVREIGDAHVGICLDTVNSMGVPEGPRQVVTELAPYVVNLHLKDFTVQRVPSMQGFVVEGRPTGEGMLDVPWLLGELARFGRTQSAIIELWSSPQATVEQTILTEEEWAQRSVCHARQWLPD